MSRTLTTLLAAALGATLLLMVLEAALHLLPVQNGLAGADPAPDWPTHRLRPDVHYTFSDAWDLRNVHRGFTNNMGYVAPFPYRPGSDGIAVVGNSFIEGLMNRYEETLQGQLARLLPDAPAMLNFGVSGASLADYIGVGPMISRRFRVRWAVVVVVAGDFVGGFAPAPGYFGWNAGNTPPVQLRPQPVCTGGAPLLTCTAKLVRWLAIVRYTRGNLRFDLRHFLHTSTKGAPRPCVPEGLQAGDADLLAAYADRLPAAYGVPPERVILVFDADRAELYRSHGMSTSSSCATRDSVARNALAAAAARRGEHVIDMGPVFAAYFKATGGRLDYSPSDWHWNAAGHRLAAAEVARIMRLGSPETDRTPGPP